MTLDAADTAFVSTAVGDDEVGAISSIQWPPGELTRPEKIDRLTSIRGFAALHVALYHCEEVVAGFNLRPWTGMVAKGYLAVDFFFLLSGFILAHVAVRVSSGVHGGGMAHRRARRSRG